MDDQPLVIDRASAAVRLDDDFLVTWASDKRMFISSVMAVLKNERAEVAQAVRDLGAEPVWFEEFGGRDQDPEEAYLAEVASSDVYVGILGRRYGRQLPDGFSATHREYLHALERGLRISVWVLDADDLEGHQRSFLDEVRAFFTTETYANAAQLGVRVGERLRKIAAEDVAPWCRLDHVVFRANRIRDERDRVIVEAVVKDPDVAHALGAMSPDGFGRGRTSRLTYSDRTLPVTVESLTTTVTAGTSQTMELTLRTSDRGSTGDPLSEIAFNTGTSTLSPDDLTELGLRSVLFGEDHGLGHMGGLARVASPIEPLRGVDVSEEVVRPILRLLLVESLVASGRAGRITAFRLGAPSPQGRRLLLEWETPRRYTNVEPERRQIEGVTPL